MPTPNRQTLIGGLPQPISPTFLASRSGLRLRFDDGVGFGTDFTLFGGSDFPPMLEIDQSLSSCPALLKEERDSNQRWFSLIVDGCGYLTLALLVLYRRGDCVE
ncbi:uncharacterized protein LOC143849549 [Tasmannia lanceolata]|uniref:uncharacterized protein LOC143849549 n=1 Tax=Tasmannia lanceolata TaxID=3420 RepID=UPI004063D2F9